MKLRKEGKKEILCYSPFSVSFSVPAYWLEDQSVY